MKKRLFFLSWLMHLPEPVRKQPLLFLGLLLVATLATAFAIVTCLLLLAACLLNYMMPPRNTAL
jgi:hypothetical protein